MPYDEHAELLLRRTLFLWIFPYIFWFFGKLVYHWVYEWVTEPVELSRKDSSPNAGSLP